MYIVEMELHDLSALSRPAKAPLAKIASIRIAEAETHQDAEAIIERINAKTYEHMPRLLRLKVGLQTFYGPRRDLAVVYTKRSI